MPLESGRGISHMKFAIFEKSSFTRKGKLACAIIALIMAYYLFIEPVYSLEYYFQDQLLRKKNTPEHCFKLSNSKKIAPVALILIDDESLQKKKISWPVPRSVYCEIIEKLEKIDPPPRVIGLDLFFPDRSQSMRDDLAFARVFHKYDNIVLGTQLQLGTGDNKVIYPYFAGGFEYVDKTTGKTAKLPALSKEKVRSNLGFVNSGGEDSSGVHRMSTILLTRGNTTYCSFDALLLARYLGIAPDELKDFASEGFQMIGPLKVPVERGFMWINYFGVSQGEGMDQALFSTYSLDSFLTEKDTKNLSNYFGGKVVVIGASATGSFEKRETPLGATLGVVVRINILSTISSGEFLRPAPAIWRFLMIFLPSLILVLVIPYVSPFIGALLYLIGLAVISSFTSHEFISKGTFYYPASAMLALTLNYSYMSIFNLIRINKARHRLKGLLQQLAPLPEPVMEKIMERQKGKVALGGEKIELTILFSDIRGYTSLSQNLDPREVMDTLNEYYSSMGAIYKNNGGMIFDTMGDGQMVVFGVDDASKENHPYLAVKAAVEMREKLDELNETWKAEKRKPIDIGIGINTGDVSLGFLGAGDRKQFVAIGDTTNVASRIEGLTRTFNASIIVSESTFERSKDLIESEPLPPTKVKGKDEPIKIYKVTAIKSVLDLKDKMRGWYKTE